METKNSILAEHGFSAFVTITADELPRSLLFDFGFSEHGAAYNADALDLDLTAVEAMVLSHGHMDHFGGLEQLAERVGKKGIDLGDLLSLECGIGSLSSCEQLSLSQCQRLYAQCPLL